MGSQVNAQSVQSWNALRRAVLDASIGASVAQLLSADPSPAVLTLKGIALLDEKDEQRLTIAYRFDNGVEVIGKAFSDHDRAQRLARDHGALWAAALPVPEPLGVVADGSMAVHRRAPGLPLATLLADHAAIDLVHRAGSCLADLHASRPSLDRVADLSADIAKWQRWAVAIDHSAPTGTISARRLACQLADGAGALGGGAGAPIHHDFHPGHVVVGPVMTIIDLDEVRIGAPAVDIGHFEAYLHLASWRDPAVAARLDDHLHAFARGWSYRGADIGDRAIAWARAAAFMKIAWQVALGLGVVPRPSGQQRRAEVARALAAGEASVARVA